MERGKRKKGLKTILGDLDKDALIDVIIGMTKINRNNRAYLDIFMKGADEINSEVLIEDTKKKIYRFIFGTSVYGKNHPKLSEAKKVITYSSKILKDYPKHLADLKLYYVETCNEYNKEYREISVLFHHSVIRTFEKFGMLIRKNPELYDLFKGRLDELFNRSRDYSCGLSDDIESLYYGLKIEFDKGKLTIKKGRRRIDN